MRVIALVLRIMLAALVVGGGVLLLGFLSYKFVLQPQVTIMAPAGSSLSVIDMQSGSKVTQTTINGSAATLGMGIGSYQVSIENDSGRQVFYVKTAWLKRVSLRFALPAQLTPTKLANQVAYNAIGDSGSLAYLNTSSETIEQLTDGTKTMLDGMGSNAPRDPASAAQALKVIAGNRAIVLTHSKLYVLQDGRLDPLRTDGFPDSISSLAIGTNPSQESFAVLANNALYWYQSPSAQPQQIAKLGKQADQLAIGGDQIIAYSTRMPNAKQNIRYAYAATYAIDPVIISVTSGSQHTVGTGPIADASISPDGQYATIEQRGSAFTDVVRLSDGARVQGVENADTLSPVWISNTRYVYGKGSSILAFDLETLSAASVATLPRGQLITSVTYNSQKQRYLVTTYLDDQEAAIYQLQ